MHTLHEAENTIFIETLLLYPSMFRFMKLLSTTNNREQYRLWTSINIVLKDYNGRAM